MQLIDRLLQLNDEHGPHGLQMEMITQERQRLEEERLEARREAIRARRERAREPRN